MYEKIGFVVEGRSDDDVLKEILKKLTERRNTSLPFEVKVVKGGKIKNTRILKNSIENLMVLGCQRIMVLMDSHCNPSDLRNKFGEYIANIGGELFVVEHAIESWLLADVSAISLLLRKRIRKRIPNLIERHKPEEILNDIFKEYARRDYDEVRDAGRIAENADIDNMENYSNFKDFLQSLPSNRSH
jgi:hypothetical protein